MKKILDINGTKIFYRNLESKAKVVINRGSARSSKSFSILQVLVYRFLRERKKKILILRKTLPSLRISTWIAFKEILNTLGISNFVKEEKQFLNYYFEDNFIHFGSLDDFEKIKCFHPDTDIFTENGFKNVKDVKVGEKVASMNPETKVWTWMPVSKTFEYDYKGKMISPASAAERRLPYTNFCVTPNHKMLYRTKEDKNYGFVEADKLPTHYTIPQAGIYNEGDIIDYFEIPVQPYTKRKNNKFEEKPNNIPIIPFLKFLGWYLSNGCIYPAKGTIRLTQMNQVGIDAIKEDLKDFPYQLKYSKGFNIYGKDLAYYLSQFGKSYEKFIPKEIKKLHPSLLKYLFDCLIKGSGRVITKNKTVYVTSSLQLANDVSEIAIKLGYTVTMRNYTPVKGKITYHLDIVNRTEVGLINKKEIDYDGKVYCIEVPPYHTTLTRYNGKLAWTGQSTEWNYIFMEEATEFDFNDFRILKLRLSAPTKSERNQIFLAFNPIDEFHWIKEKLMPTETDLEEIHSTYKDNPFLSADYKQSLEDLAFQDPNFYRIYALGEWGRLENLIYRNWEIQQINPFDILDTFYGLDFGFNEPSALIKIQTSKSNNKILYVTEMLYQSNLLNSELITRMDRLVDKKHSPIFADSAEPDRIKEIKLAGFNVKPAKKIVLDGIDSVKRYLLKIDKYSVNIQKELKAYSWKVDKNGTPTDEPIEFLDHALSALRYGVHTYLLRPHGVRVRWI